jgi:tetratricopeptide (TPR) repeat protein
MMSPESRFDSPSSVSRILIILLLVGATTTVTAAPRMDDTETRNRAFELCQQSKFATALPILERLAQAHPLDLNILERLGAAFIGMATKTTDPAERKQFVLRARSVFVHAKDLGDKNDYVSAMLEQLPEDGEAPAFPTQQDLDDAKHEGEAAFDRSDFPAAIATYKRVLQLDPKSYDAALFLGEAYQNIRRTGKAGEWFAKAIAIDPNIETAYRYWGDALLQAGKAGRAQAKYIEAVLAEPYKPGTWDSLSKAVRANHGVIAHPRIESPASNARQQGTANFNVPAQSGGKKDGGEAWAVYSRVRATWRGEHFAKEFPKEKTYRHSLREEAGALEFIATSLEKNYPQPSDRQHLQPQLQTLLELYDRGMIEPYILISTPDSGIARDYADYRAEHRDKLRAYISQVLIQPEDAAK